MRILILHALTSRELHSQVATVESAKQGGGRRAGSLGHLGLWGAGTEGWAPGALPGRGQMARLALGCVAAQRWTTAGYIPIFAGKHMI